MPELKTYTLKCPGCGATLKVGESVELFACTYCGASVRLERGEGIVSLRLLNEAILNIQRGTNRTVAELTIIRLLEEIKILQRELDAKKKQIRRLDEQQSSYKPPSLLSKFFMSKIDRELQEYLDCTNAMASTIKELRELHEARRALEDRLQKFNKKLAETRAIVDL